MLTCTAAVGWPSRKNTACVMMLRGMTWGWHAEGPGFWILFVTKAFQWYAVAYACMHHHGGATILYACPTAWVRGTRLGEGHRTT